MLSLAIVARNPGHDDAFGLLEGLEVVQSDTFLLQGAEEALDDLVVLQRFAVRVDSAMWCLRVEPPQCVTVPVYSSRGSV